MPLTATKPTVLCFVNERREPAETSGIYLVTGGTSGQEAKVGDYLIVAGELYQVTGVVETADELRLNLVCQGRREIFRAYTSWESKP